LEDFNKISPPREKMVRPEIERRGRKLLAGQGAAEESRPRE
jgi:hypothetical protein